MKKKITVIMKEGRKAQDPQELIKKVSIGYAFNYLIPKQIAEIATEGKIKHLRMLHRIASRNQDFIHDQNMKTKYKLESIRTIRIRKKCSDSQLIFGSISGQDIAGQIIQLTGEKIDRKQIMAAESKKLGKYRINIKIGDSTKASIGLHIIPRII